MKKHLLLLTVSYALVTLIPVNMYASDTLEKLNKVTIGLGPESKSFVKK